MRRAGGSSCGIEVEDATWYKLRSLAEDHGLADQLELTDVE